METSNASSLSASGICSGLFTFAMSTLIPFCNMGVTTMKMISRTSITSTMGVTLISEVTFAPSFRFEIAIDIPRYAAIRTFLLRFEVGEVRRWSAPAPDKQLTAETRPRSSYRLPANIAALLQEVVDQFARRVIHLDVERFHAAGQVVEHHDGRDGDEQPDGSRDQRFRDTAGDGSQTGGLRVVDADEGVQNAHHRAEQSHEGSSRTDGGEAAQSTLQFGVDNSFGALQSALRGLDGFARDCARAILVSLELHQAGGDNLGQMALLVALGNLDSLVNAAIAQSARDCRGKGTRLLTSSAIGHPAVDHHANGPARHDEQDDDDGSSNPSHCLPQAQRIGRHGTATFLDDPGGCGRYVIENACYVNCEHELLFPPRRLFTLTRNL